MLDFAALAKGIANEYAVKESKEKETREERTKEENKEIESKETNIYSFNSIQDNISNSSNNISKNIFPSFKDVSDYIISSRLPCDIDRFFSYYSGNGWKDRNGEALKNWKNMAIKWADNETDKEFVLKRNLEMAQLRDRIETKPQIINLTDIPVENLPPVPSPYQPRPNFPHRIID